MMRRDLPTPAEILEGLADNAAAQMERRRPVAFDRALREMTEYHRFLLELSASHTPDGSAFNFAAVAGNDWLSPHQEWIGQYRRLFERAADHLSDDDHYLRSLAYASSRLLRQSESPELPPNIIGDILGLGPVMVHRLEAWFTKRMTIERPAGEAAKPRFTLTGMDAKAYADVLPAIVGAWESLLQHAPPMYGWRERGEKSDAERWSAFGTSWPFLWQHLSSTAHCLAATVWNEDEDGAALFRESLVRWPQTLDHRLDDHAELRHRRLLFPTVLRVSWPEARARVAPLGYDYMPDPTPEQLFASVVRGAHDDVMLLTAAVLLFWTVNEKQGSDIGGRTARSLLRRERDDADPNHRAGQDPGFRSLLLDLLRWEMAGMRFRDDSYAAQLDGLVRLLDTMTERRVVPGRGFTPSTLHGQDDLLLSVLAIMIAWTPDEGDDGLVERIRALAHEEAVLPEEDGSLRSILYRLRQFASTLEQSWSQLSQGVAVLAPERDIERLRNRLRQIVVAAEEAIEAERRQRLEVRPVDPAKLERIRSAIEAALLTGPAEVPFFKKVEVVQTNDADEVELRELNFNAIPKAYLTNPPMDLPGSGFEEMFISRSRQAVGSHAWTAFCQRARNTRAVSGAADHEVFWEQIVPLIDEVGPDPTLVVSRHSEGRALHRFMYAPPADRPRLAIEQRADNSRSGSYIATVQGVDVFGADFPPGRAWLFSGRALRGVRYAPVGQSGRYVEIFFELGADMKGTLRVRIRERLEWDGSPIFDLQALNADSVEGT